MKKFILSISMAATLWPIANAAAQSKVQSQILGLVEIPNIFGKEDPNGPPGQIVFSQKRLVSIYEKPTFKSKIIVKISEKQVVMAREHGYESESAIVYGRDNGWYLIETKAGRGWISPQDAGTFRPYENLLKENLSFLDKKAWDGRFYETPDNVERHQQLTAQSDQLDVVILETKFHNGQLWLRVQLREGLCEGKEKRGKKGWVKAYSEIGEPNLWFYSRGC